MRPCFGRSPDALPNVTGIRISDVLAAVASVVGKLAAALTAAGSVTLASGALVLAGTVAAGQRRRLEDAVVLKTLGATRPQIRAAWLVEFGMIGGLRRADRGRARHCRELGRGASGTACALGVPAADAVRDGAGLRAADAGGGLLGHGRGAALAAGRLPAQPVARARCASARTSAPCLTFG